MMFCLFWFRRVRAVRFLSGGAVGSGERRDEVAERGGEPPLKGWLGPLKSNGSRSCCRNGGASDGV